MAWFGPGPFAATLLGDLGAEIVKVHEPDPEARGGLAKYAFPNTPEFPGLRNCKTIGVDLKSEAGRAVFYDLVRSADVVFESFRPGVMKRLRTDYATVKEINPAIIYASLSGYGQYGPYRDTPGHDINYISIGGLLGLTGEPDGPPVLPGTLVADFAAGGMASVIGILAALMAREKTGRGQFVDVAIMDGIVEMMGMWINPYLSYGFEAERGRTIFTGQYAWYNVYETKDGKYISVGTFEHWFYANLCKALGREDFIEHQWASGDKAEEIHEFFRQTFLTKTRDEWLELLVPRETCVAPVYTISEMAADPQVIARGMVRDMLHPSLGVVRQVGSMLKLSDSGFEVRNWTTQFGQHTDEILEHLGYDAERIAALREEQAIS